MLFNLYTLENERSFFMALKTRTRFSSTLDNRVKNAFDSYAAGKGARYSKTDLSDEAYLLLLNRHESLTEDVKPLVEMYQIPVKGDFTFANYDHQEMFEEFKELVTAKKEPYDREYDTALYLLSFLQSQRKDIRPFIGQFKIDHSSLIAKSEPWSTAEKLLIKLSASCFSSGFECPIGDLFRSVSGDFKMVAVEAIKYRWA